jgi:hypothetical protein
MFKEIIAVYSENHKKQQIQKAALLTVNVDGSYSYRLGLKGRANMTVVSASNKMRTTIKTM